MNAETETPLPDHKPAFLKRVRIRGYKSIAFCDVTLEPLTILVGHNASGKSNFVEALSFLRDVLNRGLGFAVREHQGIKAILNRCTNDREIRFDLECSLPDTRGVYKTAHYHLTIAAESHNTLRTISEQFSVNGDATTGYERPQGFTIANATGMYDLEGFEHRNLTSIPDHRKAMLAQLIASLRTIVGYNFIPSAYRRPLSKDNGGFLEHDALNITSVVQSIMDNSPKTMNRINRYLRRIAQTVQFSRVQPVGGYEVLVFNIATSPDAAPIEFDASAMSDGTLRAFASLVAAFQTIPEEGSPSFVAIEEPETSLHPAAMHALVDALDEATLRTQILITTHSADLLDCSTIKPENVRVVQMIDGFTWIGPIDEVGKEIIARKLCSLGDLERQNQLNIDEDDLARQREEYTKHEVKPEAVPA